MKASAESWRGLATLLIRAAGRCWRAALAPLRFRRRSGYNPVRCTLLVFGREAALCPELRFLLAPTLEKGRGLHCPSDKWLPRMNLNDSRRARRRSYEMMPFRTA